MYALFNGGIMSSNQLAPHINLWIEHDGKVVFSAWRVRLLQAIRQTGSISGAAEQMGIQYRLAWERLQEMEEGLGVALVERQVGGVGGGGAQLTATCIDLMERFDRLAAEVGAHLNEQFKEKFEFAS